MADGMRPVLSRLRSLVTLRRHAISPAALTYPTAVLTYLTRPHICGLLDRSFFVLPFQLTTSNLRVESEFKVQVLASGCFNST